MKSHNRTKQYGFTLLELFMTVVIVSILVGLAAPSFREMTQNNKLTTRTNEFVTSMQLARSEAVKRGVRVSMQATNGGNTSDEWGPGWRVWADLNGNDAFDANEQLHLIADRTDPITLDSSNNQTRFRYDVDGTVNVNQRRWVDVCDTSRNGEIMRRVFVSPTGHVTMEKSDDSPAVPSCT